ncbi:hypothetical protein B0H17DRAFT_1028780 [Mycena rosella]|uniref:Uncharacterized protein n=1 Tax=Mycena rosella TaxID=1033263 RepID=A0AAD7MBL6_MYCRO|nr:hypothetical protein B0H17DRAFT_1028780 [Mycena rosella]
MESTIYDINLMDTTPVSPDASQFLAASIQCPPAIPAMPVLEAFSPPLPDPTMQVPMLAPVPYMPAPIATFDDYAQYPAMDQASDSDLLSRPPTQMQPPSAAIHGLGASYNLNNTSSLASALDPGGVAPGTRSRANTLSSQTAAPFIPLVPVVSFAPGVVGDIPVVKQEEMPKERVVGNMLKSIADVIKSAGDACHQHQAARPITPGDEQKTRQVIAQINDLIHGMGLPTNAHAEVSRKRHAGDLKDGEQPPVKKILKPEPEDVNLSALPVAVAVPPPPGPFVRTHTASRSQPSSRPQSPPPNAKPVPSNFRPGFPVFTVPNPQLDNPHRFGPGYRHQHSRSMGSIPRETHGFSPTSAPAGRMGRTGYFLPEHGWATKGGPAKSAPTLATFTYPGPVESIVPISAISAISCSSTDVVDEEDEDNDGDADDNDTSSPSGSSNHSYPDGPPAGSEIPQEYRAEVDRVFIQYLNWICSNLDAADNKGDPIHQQLMPKKMQKLDESTDFRPFKFRIQAFTAAFLEELADHGYPEEKIPMKKVRNYLWRQPLILRFNEDGKKAKSKGNHIWNVEAKKIGDRSWEFRPFHRKIAGNAPAVAYCGLQWRWQARIWDPQACWQNVHVQYSSPSLPSWLQWKDDVLSGTPPSTAESCDITTHAKFTLDGQDGFLTRTFPLSIAPRAAETPFGPGFVQRPSITPRRTVSDSTIPARSIPLTPALVTAEEDEARVKMVLEHVAHRLTQESQPPGYSPELSRQKHVLELTVNACDYEHSSNAPEGSHELAVAGQNVVARAAEYIVRGTAPGAAALPTKTSAMQNVTTEDLVETTKDAIAEAVKESRGTSEIDELSILLIACRVLDNALRPQPQWGENSPPTLHMPPPPDWYVGYV